MKCEFCGGEIEAPQDFNEGTKKCQHCGAIYWLEFTDDLWLANQEAADHLKVDYNKMFEKIELKIVRDFDKIGEEKGDEFEEEVCLVSARIKPNA